MAAPKYGDANNLRAWSLPCVAEAEKLQAFHYNSRKTREKRELFFKTKLYNYI